MTDPKTIASFHVICREVLRSCPNSEAIGYASRGLVCHTADAVHSQALYLLSNLSHWRHIHAKPCRQALRDIIAALEPSPRH